MVKFKDLANDKKNRKIRELVFIGGETIKVFEPSESDVEAIVALQEKFVGGANEEDGSVNLTVTGYDLIKVLFPLLTDVEGIDELSEKEIEFVVENPSLAFLQANHVIEGIVTEVYKTTILAAKNRLLETDFRIESSKANSEILERTLGLAEKENKTTPIMKKIAEAADKYEQAVAKEAAQNNTPKINPHNGALKRFEGIFGE